MGAGAGLYMYDVVVKSSRSLCHLLLSSCTNGSPQNVIVVSRAPYRLHCNLYRAYIPLVMPILHIHGCHQDVL